MPRGEPLFQISTNFSISSLRLISVEILKIFIFHTFMFFLILFNLKIILILITESSDLINLRVLHIIS